MSDKDQSAISKEKENNYEQNNITNKYEEKQRRIVGKESMFITFFATLFLIDLIFMIVVDVSIVDFILCSDFCFSTNFSRSNLGIFTKIFLFGGIIGLLLIFLKGVFDFFSKN